MKKLLAAAMLVSLSLGCAGNALAATAQDNADAHYQQLKAKVEALKLQVADAKQENEQIKAKKEESNIGNRLKLTGDMRIKAINQHIGKHTTLTESVQLKAVYNFTKDLQFGVKYCFMSDNNMGTTVDDVHHFPNFSDGNQRYDDAGAADNHHIMNLYLKKNHFLGDNSPTIGRMGPNILATQYWSSANSSGFFDGARLAFGHNEDFEIWYGDWGAADTYDKYWNHANNFSATKHKGLEKCYMLMGKHKFGDGGPTLYGWLLNEVQDANYKEHYKMRGVGISQRFGDWRIDADFTKNEAQDALGHFIRLRYKGSDRAVPGSWTIGLDHVRYEPGNIYATALNGVNDVSLGMRDQLGVDTFILWADYILRRNLRLAVYQSIGRKSLRDYSDSKYGTFTRGGSAPSYSRIHLVWTF